MQPGGLVYSLSGLLNSYRFSTLLLLVVLLVVCLPRFDRNEFLIASMVGTDMQNDSAEYVAMVEVFRGNEPNLQPSAPFTYRPLVPFLASLIPLPAMTAINVLNLLAMGVGAMCMRQATLVKQVPLPVVNLLILSYIVSFPVFYYGAIGYLDPVAIGAIGVGCWLIQSRRDMFLVLLIFAGVFVKETIILLLPVYLVYGWVERRSVPQMAFTLLAAVLAYFIATSVARTISLDQASYIWSPSLERLQFNVGRIRTWLSMLLSIGLTGTAALAASVMVLLHRNWTTLTKILPWLTGMAGSFALFAYSMLSAYSDGRFIWPSIVFAVPLLGQVYLAYVDRSVILSRLMRLLQPR